MKKKQIIFTIYLFAFSTSLSNACTIFSYAKGGEVFAAANEDDYTPFIRIWFNPRTKERYGSVCFGAPDMQVASAMNEYGLFFDFAAASFDPSKLKSKNPYSGFLMWDVLGKCRNVKEALEIITKYDYNSPSQVLLADAEGNSVLINPEGTIKKNGDFQINANCNLVNKKISCRRPELVKEMLSGSSENSALFLKKVLDKTHQEGELTTLHSTIYDLKRGIIYVYLFHNYDAVYKIDIKKELGKGYRIENLDDHFPSFFAYESFIQNHSLYLKESIINEINTKGLEITVDRYLSANKTTSSNDSMLKPALLEVALQLIKYSWNEHSNGGMWDYFFSLPAGYNIQHFTDKRLHEASRVLHYLTRQKNIDNKLRNFIYEMYAYVNLVQGDLKMAKEYYEKSISNPSETYEVSFLRVKEMLGRMNTGIMK